MLHIKKIQSLYRWAERAPTVSQLRSLERRPGGSLLQEDRQRRRRNRQSGIYSTEMVRYGALINVLSNIHRVAGADVSIVRVVYPPQNDGIIVWFRSREQIQTSSALEVDHV